VSTIVIGRGRLLADASVSELLARGTLEDVFLELTREAVDFR
jgi:hypothetical protein